MKIYGDTQSGNCYKIKLLCQLLNIEHDWIDVDILKNETKTQEFLNKNPAGQIPLLELDDGRCLAQSNAVLFYLSSGSNLQFKDEYHQAQILQWQFFEQYSHEPYIAVARFINKYLGLPEDKIQEYQDKQAGGHQALQVMEQQLSQTDFLVAGQFSIADISLYAYTHVADEGGFNLDNYPAISAWIARIQALPNYCGM